MICKSMLVLLLCFWITAAQIPRKLVYVQAVWRHGDRAPAKLPYPKDTHAESEWLRGWAQITNLGMKQTYELGQFLRQRYSALLGTVHRVQDVAVTSTSVERAIVSAQGVLRGMYPASRRTQWMTGENWQPTSFGSRSPNEPDLMLRPTKEKCPTYDNLITAEKLVQFKEIERQYRDVFTQLSRDTGYSPFATKEACKTAALRFEMNHGLSQPPWVTKTWPSHGNKKAVEIINKIKWDTRYNEFNTPFKSRFSAGILAGDFLAKAKAVAAGRAVVPSKINFFSGHDGTVIPLLVALGISNGLDVPLASCVIMEVYKTPGSNKVETLFLYRNETNPGRVYEMTVQGCTTYCPLEKLVQLIGPNTFGSPEEYRRACAVTGAARRT